MVKIRLRRIGAKKKPVYRVVIAEARSRRDGAFLETLGHFDPRREPNTLVINEAKALHWLRHGAQPTPTAARLLAKLGILEKFHHGSQEQSEPEQPQNNQS